MKYFLLGFGSVGILFNAAGMFLLPKFGVFQWVHTVVSLVALTVGIIIREQRRVSPVDEAENG